MADWGQAGVAAVDNDEEAMLRLFEELLGNQNAPAPAVEAGPPPPVGPAGPDPRDELMVGVEEMDLAPEPRQPAAGAVAGVMRPEAERPAPPAPPPAALAPPPTPTPQDPRTEAFQALLQSNVQEEQRPVPGTPGAAPPASSAEIDRTAVPADATQAQSAIPTTERREMEARMAAAGEPTNERDAKLQELVGQTGEIDRGPSPELQRTQRATTVMQAIQSAMQMVGGGMGMSRDEGQRRAGGVMNRVGGAMPVALPQAIYAGREEEAQRDRKAKIDQHTRSTAQQNANSQTMAMENAVRNTGLREEAMRYGMEDTTEDRELADRMRDPTSTESIEARRAMSQMLMQIPDSRRPAVTPEIQAALSGGSADDIERLLGPPVRQLLGQRYILPRADRRGRGNGSGGNRGRGDGVGDGAGIQDLFRMRDVEFIPDDATPETRANIEREREGLRDLYRRGQQGDQMARARINSWVSEYEKAESAAAQSTVSMNNQNWQLGPTARQPTPAGMEAIQERATSIDEVGAIAQQLSEASAAVSMEDIASFKLHGFWPGGIAPEAQRVQALHGRLATAIRNIEQTGVPQQFELASIRARFPSLDTWTSTLDFVNSNPAVYTNAADSYRRDFEQRLERAGYQQGEGITSRAQRGARRRQNLRTDPNAEQTTAGRDGNTSGASVQHTYDVPVTQADGTVEMTETVVDANSDQEEFFRGRGLRHRGE